MSSLKLSSKSQVTFKKDVLNHLGVRPGDRVQIDLEPNGKVTVRAEKADKSLESFVGILAHPDNPVLSLDDIKRITEEAWAGKR